MRTTLKEWLYLIPKDDRRLAYHAWKGGAFRIAKFPVTGTWHAGDSEQGKPAGLPRPLLCPEPPPKGCHFELTWDSGSGWFVMSLRDQVLSHLSPLLESAHQMYASAISEISSDETNANPMLPHQRKVARQALDEAVKMGASSDAIALAFLAGVVFSSCSTMNNLRPKIRHGTFFAPGRKVNQDVEWGEIITAAIERHERITPSKLLKILGGEREYDKHTGDEPLNFKLAGDDDSYWHYRPKKLPAIEWKRFSRLVYKANDRHGRLDSEKIPHT